MYTFTHRRRAAYRRLAFAGAAIVVGALVPSVAPAQWSTTYETFYLQAKHNWVFRDNYMAADRLFNAFDYGHAILYERLYTEPNAPASNLEVDEYNKLTRHVLVRPPRVPLEEAAIEIRYAQLAPEAKVMFDWAHILHRQIYDVLADERMSQDAKDREVQRLITYYKTRRDVAFSSKPKSMELMQEQPYSLAFRKQYPKFNGLIWGYHWLQVGLYEPLMTGRTVDERQFNVRATVARFWQMLQDAPNTMPHQMPMTAAVSPTFAARYPEAAIIFDNLHSMHDVISDILANDSVPMNRKRPEIMRAARLYRDDTSYVMSVDAWRTMSREMGVENMGGVASNFLPALPTPTVTYGAVMHHDNATGKMVSVKYGQMLAGHDMGAMSTTGDSGSMAGMNHGAMAADSGRARADSGMAEMNHGAMPGMNHGAPAVSAPGMAGMNHGGMAMPAGGHTMGDSSMMQPMMEMHMRMMADPVIRQRMMADTAMRRMMTDMMASMPAEHRAMMQRMMRAPATPAARRPAAGSRPATKAAAKPAVKKPVPKPVPKPKPDPMQGMDHSKMPGMKTP